MKIFGIPINNISQKEILVRIEMFLDESKFHRVSTVNPEFLLEAEKNESFKMSLLDADLRIVDGFGIVLAGWLKGECIRRFSGADLMEEILKIANEKKLSVFLAVNKEGLSTFTEVRDAILKKYPYIQIQGSDFDLRKIGNWKLEIGGCAIILCNFGAPAQELFLARLKEQNVESRLAIGIGGAFDYLTGKQKRAPKLLRSIGLEWFWRLVLQPKRFKRIWNATAVFIFKVLIQNIKTNL